MMPTNRRNRARRLRGVVTAGTGTPGVDNGSSDVAPGNAAQREHRFDRSTPMRKYLIPAVVVLGLATPALADDSADIISMQAAVDVATDIGLATISHTQFAGDEWQIEGKDLSGRYIEVDVDAATGAVLNVDR
jgi:hypothetical protein